MAYTAEQFMAMDLDANEAALSKCVNCDCVLQEVSTGNRWTKTGPSCSDCYFEELGKAVEESPIITARVRRG